MVTTPSRKFRWTRASDAELLALRFDELRVSLRGTWLERGVMRLHGELTRRNVRHRPHVWLSEEWFSPTSAPGFAIPFYLTHPRLMRLERAQMRMVDGGTVPECMAIMRHETGHAIQTAYRLHTRAAWRRTYARWPAALAKIEYVDALMREIGNRRPIVASRRTYHRLRDSHRTLGAHYAARRRHYRRTPSFERRGWLPL